MTSYLSYQFIDDEKFINTFDELPLWSAPFGLLLLKHIPLKPNLKVLDIGSGAGFPLTELASRLGASSKIYGIDPWKNANARARQKISNYELSNVEIMECDATEIPMEANSIDLIVSNLGINNFENPDAVFKECYRLLKPNGKLALTSNINGHWDLFYQLFYKTLQQLGKQALIPALEKEEAHRGTLAMIKTLFVENGFKVLRDIEESFDMRFLDGTAFLNHHFVKVGWLTTWLKLFPEADWQSIFSALEANLNTHALSHNGLTLRVPMVFVEGSKS